MRPEFDIVTFDCYGTLVDWRAGIVGAFREAGRLPPDVTGEHLLRLHAEIEPAVQSERFRSYRDVLRLTALRMIDRMGGTPPQDGGDFLPDSVTAWPVFADTNAALARLRATGMELGILSNIDDELLRGTLRQIDVDFAFAVTAEQVQAYKPNHAHFLAARDRVGSRRWLHAAQSFFHDIQPAHDLGIPAAWVNRLAEAPHGDAVPDMEIRDLEELANQLAGG